MPNYSIPRYRVQLVRETFDRADVPRFANSADVVRFCLPLCDGADVERLFVLTLDSKNKWIGISMVSQGSLNQSIVHPREVFKPAILTNAASIILVHNHPSGDPAPSADDRDCTRRIFQAGRLLGIRLTDHVIIGDGDAFSFADSGQLEVE